MPPLVRFAVIVLLLASCAAAASSSATVAPRTAASSAPVSIATAKSLVISAITRTAVATPSATVWPVSTTARSTSNQLLQVTAAPTSSPVPAVHEGAGTAAVAECAATEHQVASGSSQFWVYVIICLCLVCFGGLMSGLTVGFMSIDRLKLEVLKEAGTPEEKERVERVRPILENHHLLLVTLLFCNAMAMEALPIFLDRLVPSVVAVILSVSFVLILGEVVPQAIFVANPLQICASVAWIVRILQVVSYPVAYPVAKLLDRILGDHSSHVLFKRSELGTLINLHDEQKKGPLEKDEANVIRGALEFGNKKAKDIMTNIEHICMLEIDRILDMNTLAEILGMGHSRIPVFHKSRHNVKGLLLVKRLIVCNPDDNRPVYHFVHRKPIVVPPSIGLYELLNFFQTGRSHLAIVTDHTREYQWSMSTGEDVAGYCRIQGIVTLEDVIEQLIKEEIADEVDVGFSAASRPWEKEEERGEHRTAGVEKARNMFRKLLYKIRRRKHDKMREILYGGAMNGGQNLRLAIDTSEFDPSALQMNASGDVVFDTSQQDDTGSNLPSSSVLSRAESFFDVPNPDGDQQNLGSSSAVNARINGRPPAGGSFGSYRRPIDQKVLGDAGAPDGVIAPKAAAQIDLLGAAVSVWQSAASSAKKKRAPIPSTPAVAQQSPGPHRPARFSPSPQHAVNRIYNQVGGQWSAPNIYTGQRVFLQGQGQGSQSTTHRAGSNSHLPPMARMQRTSQLQSAEVYNSPSNQESNHTAVGDQQQSNSQFPSAARMQRSSSLMNSSDVYGSMQSAENGGNIPNLDYDMSNGEHSDSLLPRMATMARQIVENQKAPSPPHSPRRTGSTGSAAMPPSPLATKRNSTGSGSPAFGPLDAASDKDEEIDLNEVIADDSPFLSASAFDMISKSSHERGLRKIWKQSQKKHADEKE